MLRGVRPGELDRRLLIQRCVETSDLLTNQPIKTWSDVSTVWGKRMFKSSGEKYGANQTIGSQTYDYLIRYPNSFTLDQKMRITDLQEQQIYYINGINYPDRKVTAIITVERKDNE